VARSGHRFAWSRVGTTADYVAVVITLLHFNHLLRDDNNLKGLGLRIRQVLSAAWI